MSGIDSLASPCCGCVRCSFRFFIISSKSSSLGAVLLLIASLMMFFIKDFMEFILLFVFS